MLQMSMPDLDPEHLFAIGRRLAPLRDEGVLVIGSGFMTHGLPFVREYMMTGKTGAPQWSMEFDRWATEALERRDIDSLFDFRRRAPGMPYAHPTVEHFAPLFVALGAATDRRRSRPTRPSRATGTGCPSAPSRCADGARPCRPRMPADC